MWSVFFRAGRLRKQCQISLFLICTTSTWKFTSFIKILRDAVCSPVRFSSVDSALRHKSLYNTTALEMTPGREATSRGVCFITRSLHVVQRLGHLSSALAFHSSSNPAQHRLVTLLKRPSTRAHPLTTTMIRYALLLVLVLVTFYITSRLSPFHLTLRFRFVLHSIKHFNTYIHTSTRAHQALFYFISYSLTTTSVACVRHASSFTQWKQTGRTAFNSLLHGTWRTYRPADSICARYRKARCMREHHPIRFKYLLVAGEGQHRQWTSSHY